MGILVGVGEDSENVSSKYLINISFYSKIMEYSEVNELNIDFARLIDGAEKTRFVAS